MTTNYSKINDTSSKSNNNKQKEILNIPGQDEDVDNFLASLFNNGGVTEVIGTSSTNNSTVTTVNSDPNNNKEDNIIVNADGTVWYNFDLFDSVEEEPTTSISGGDVENVETSVENIETSVENVEMSVDNTPIVDSTPLVDSIPLGDSTSLGDNSPIIENQSIGDNTPTVENTPVVDSTSLVDSTPLVDNTLTVENQPSGENTPIIENQPTVENQPTGNNTPTVGDNTITVGEEYNFDDGDLNTETVGDEQQTTTTEWYTGTTEDQNNSSNNDSSPIVNEVETGRESQMIYNEEMQYDVMQNKNVLNSGMLEYNDEYLFVQLPMVNVENISDPMELLRTLLEYSNRPDLLDRIDFPTPVLDAEADSIKEFSDEVVSNQSNPIVNSEDSSSGKNSNQGVNNDLLLALQEDSKDEDDINLFEESQVVAESTPIINEQLQVITEPTPIITASTSIVNEQPEIVNKEPEIVNGQVEVVNEKSPVVEEISVDQQSILSETLKQSSTTDQPSSDQSSPDQSTTDQSSPDQSTTDQSTPDQSKTDQPTVCQSTVSQSTNDQSTVSKTPVKPSIPIRNLPNNRMIKSMPVLRNTVNSNKFFQSIKEGDYQGKTITQITSENNAAIIASQKEAESKSTSSNGSESGEGINGDNSPKELTFDEWKKTEEYLQKETKKASTKEDIESEYGIYPTPSPVVEPIDKTFSVNLVEECIKDEENKNSKGLIGSFLSIFSKKETPVVSTPKVTPSKPFNRPMPSQRKPIEKPKTPVNNDYSKFLPRTNYQQRVVLPSRRKILTNPQEENTSDTQSNNSK